METVDDKSIKERLENLENKLERIESLLEKIEPNCNKMGNHINFVENVYTSWRSPISWILSKITSSRVISPPITSNNCIEYNCENCENCKNLL